MDALLGWGDVLFVGCLACFCSPLHFIGFYMGSLLVVLVCWGSYQLITPGKNSTIPLAGLQALLLAVVLLTSSYYPLLDLTTDEPILNLLNR